MSLGYQKAKQALAHKIREESGGRLTGRGTDLVAVDQAERHAKLKRLEELSEPKVQQIAG